MLKAFCNHCNKPIEQEDNHFNVQQMVIVKDKHAKVFGGLHFCGIACLNPFVTKEAKESSRPSIIIPQQ